MPSSRESSEPRNGIQVSRIAGGFFIIWATREAHSESEVAQSCPTLCEPMDCSLPGSADHGILLAWAAISFSRGSGLLHCRQTLSHLSHQGSPKHLIMAYKSPIIWFPLTSWSHPPLQLFVTHAMDCSPQGTLCPWDSPGKNTGMDSHSFSRGSSPPWDWTQVSWITGRFFTIWATMEAGETVR